MLIYFIGRHEIADAYSRYDEENRKATRLLKQQSQQRIDLCHENTRVRNLKEQHRKQTESRYMKDTISNSVATFRSIVEEENELRKLNRDHCITELDPCTSTKVGIPDALTNKMKNAKR